MSEREHLAQAERLITECKNRIARRREVIANAFQKGHETEVPVSMLRALEASLRAFETHRQLILDRQKKAERR
jgi:rubrerythrin